MDYGALTAFPRTDGFPDSSIVVTAVLKGGCPLNCPFCIVKQRDERHEQVRGAAENISIGAAVRRIASSSLLTARSISGSWPAYTLPIFWRYVASSAMCRRRGTLYIVVVGVNDYDNFPDASLRYCAADARAFEAAMRRHAGPLHERVESCVLVTGGDKAPTRANVVDALMSFRDARPEDTVVVFLAGHGTNEVNGEVLRLNGRKSHQWLCRSPDYLFLPQDAAIEHGHLQASTVLFWHEVQNALQNGPGRRLLFVDTCHARGAYNQRLVKDTYDAQIVVFAASDSDTAAVEISDLGHGAFTFALMEGLSGKAACNNGEVRLFRLLDYVAERVSALTGGKQEPTASLSGMKNFVIAKCEDS